MGNMYEGIIINYYYKVKKGEGMLGVQYKT